jgi:hypothetical protein
MALEEPLCIKLPRNRYVMFDETDKSFLEHPEPGKFSQFLRQKGSPLRLRTLAEDEDPLGCQLAQG